MASASASPDAVQEPCRSNMQSAFIVSAVFCAALQAQTVWTVGPGGQFADIPQAISAARPGDRISVIGTGPFSAFTLSRGIDIDAPSQAVVPSFEVVGTLRGETARVAGLTAIADSVRVTNCAGPVLLRSVTGFPATVAAVRVTNCASVVLDNCGGTGLDGLIVDRAFATISGCSFAGSCFGGSANVGCSGGSGLYVSAGSVAFIANSSFTGVPGMSGRLAGGSGGSGIVCYGAAVAVNVICQGFPGGSGSFVNGAPGHAVTGPVRCTVGSSVNTPLAGGAVWIPDRASINPSNYTWPLGSSMSLTCAGGPDGPMLLAADFRISNAPVQAFDGLLWLSGQAIVLSHLQLSSANRSVAIGVPRVSSLAHTNVTFQGFVIVAGAVTLTPPAFVRIVP